jgi:DtxR family Mn-dependent transcriptional regulator
MPNAIFSESIEMYLKNLVELDPTQPVAISRLAGRMGVTQVSATEMVKRMAEQELVGHLPYKGVTLTARGRNTAYNVIRRQRLCECFLYGHLKIEWARVYELACDLEHATAPEVTEALAALLGEPATCPHGNPIPAADGSVTPLDGLPLSAMSIGQKGQIVAVQGRDTDVLRHLQARNVMPGRAIMLIDIAPMQGPLTLKIDDKEVALGLQMAELVIVKLAN